MNQLARGRMAGIVQAALLAAIGVHCAAVHAQAAEKVTTSCATLGVTRWDAWFGSKGVPGVAVEKTLGPSRWHDRLPVCATVVGPDSVRIRCDTDAQMVIEIDQAADAGIGYFAFVTYPPDDPMSIGLSSYLRAPNRSRLGFALISEMDRWGDKKLYRAVIERYVKFMREPNYQRTPDGRPLFFLGFVNDESMNRRFGGRAGFKSLIDEFRGLVRQAELPEPYIVMMDRWPKKAASFAKDLGLDAVSAYAVFDNDQHKGTYKQLTGLVESFWKDAGAEGVKLVPPVMSGWDRRPRVLNPLSWETHAKYSDEQMLRFFERPTPAELETHLGSALALANASPGVPARTVLAYAWNEFDEGGWLAPTRGEGTARLDAVRRAVQKSCPTAARPASR